MSPNKGKQKLTWLTQIAFVTRYWGIFSFGMAKHIFLAISEYNR
jgi:hypothetical protein